jgi:hypothetical protein
MIFDPPQEPRTPAFLSSFSYGLTDLRRNLHEEMFPDLWVAEIDGQEREFKEPLEIVDELIDRLQHSEVFICILAGKRFGPEQTGTRIMVRGRSSLVSYFEIEVFQAALSRTPMVFLVKQDFEPGEELAEFLTILRNSGVVTTEIAGLDDRRISKEVRSTIVSRHTIRKKALDSLALAAANLAAALLARRSHLSEIRYGGSDMLFLQGHRMRSIEDREFDLDQAKSLLAAASQEPRHDRRLSRLYLVLRSLMSAPYQDSMDPEVLGLWNAVLNMWWGSAAWYGLHNHLAMGAIGALWSQSAVRKRLSETVPHTDRANVVPPYGSLASAYLSLAKLIPHPFLRWRLSGIGLYLASKGIEISLDRDPTIYAVRGSLFFVRLNPLAGMIDFYRLRACARRQPENLRLNAEAHTYLGRGYTLLRLSAPAQRHLQQAVEIWKHRVHGTGKDKEFLIKSLKHLAEFQIRAKPDQAEETAREALALAEEIGASDQARQIKELLSKSR